MKEKIGIIGGTSLMKDRFFSGLKRRTITTKFGDAIVFTNQKFFFIQRHGPRKNIPPHMINNKANIGAMKKLGVSRIIGLGSVGSLKKSISPGSIVIPHDFINFSGQQTFFDYKMNDLFSAFTLSGFDTGMRDTIIRGSGNIKTKNKAVYLAVKGPRIETFAEVKMFSKFGDIIGMTIVNEAILSLEAGIKYAAICTVDNYGRGILGKEIDFKKLEHVKEKTVETAIKIINSVID